jgi:ribosomal protein L24E
MEDHAGVMSCEDTRCCSVERGGTCQQHGSAPRRILRDTDGYRSHILCSALVLTYSSQGKLFVRSDSKIFRFQCGKSESLFLQRKNPRKIAWTVLCRRQRRKGISEVRNHQQHFRPDPRWKPNTYNYHRRLPSPAVAVRSSPSVPSLVLPST